MLAEELEANSGPGVVPQEQLFAFKGIERRVNQRWTAKPIKTGVLLPFLK
jgi:hypothetical protein